MIAKEIERKFLITKLPSNLENYPVIRIKQGYIAITPDNIEVRLRQKGKKYFQTIKRGTGLQREEIEIEITQDQFEQLWNAITGISIEKDRYRLSDQGYSIELDVYHNQLSGLYTAEIEFSSQQKALSFNPPSWFGEDITEDESYKNKNLAIYGLPK